jgi:hypothetical protein
MKTVIFSSAASGMMIYTESDKENAVMKEKEQVLMDLCRAASELYGEITAARLAEVSRELWIRKMISRPIAIDELDAFTTAMKQQESLPFLIYEQKEQSEGKQDDPSQRWLISRAMFDPLDDTLHNFFTVQREQSFFPLHIDETFWTSARPVPSPEETALKTFLDELTCSADPFVFLEEQCRPLYPGMRLKQIHGPSLNEQLDLAEFTTAENRGSYLSFLKKTEASRRIMDAAKRSIRIGCKSMALILYEIENSISAFGVILSENERKQLKELFMPWYLHTPVWGLSGRTMAAELQKHGSLDELFQDPGFAEKLCVDWLIHHDNG